MNLDDITKGLKVNIKAAIKYERDIKFWEGSYTKINGNIRNVEFCQNLWKKRTF